MGGPYGRYERVQKASLQPGFDSENVQDVASCYTRYAIPVHKRKLICFNHYFNLYSFHVFSVIRIQIPQLQDKMY
jgi:hypothetical protein